MRWPLLAMLAVSTAAASPARADAEPPVRLALVVGQDVGGPTDERLRYAERDARRGTVVFDDRTWRDETEDRGDGRVGR